MDPSGNSHVDKIFLGTPFVKYVLIFKQLSRFQKFFFFRVCVCGGGVSTPAPNLPHDKIKYMIKNVINKIILVMC